ncbi:MAG: HD domain-containing protein [Deltaproteobacteria bacterium]|nr:HD domain-containing protein [Deltaproteobacteria bacterium]
MSFALEAHAAQTRKGTRIPYVSHLLQVAGLVLEHGGDAEQAIAAVLHDAIEDCEDVDAETLRARFGASVTEIVVQCSDVLPGDRPTTKSPWLVRKRRYVAQLARADSRTQLVAACDKLHNLRSLLADLRAEGPATLERFNGTPEQTRGYFETVREALCKDLPERLTVELDALLEELREFVPDSSF